MSQAGSQVYKILMRCELAVSTDRVMEVLRTWKEIMTAEFSFASFLPCVLYSGAAHCWSLATLFSYI